MKKSNYNERKSRILEVLEKKHLLPIAEIVSMLEVSSETIRQDLIKLEKDGLIHRYHGSAVFIYDEKDIVEKSLVERKEIFTTTKMKIAEEVYRHLPKERSAVIGLDVGNTVWHLAKIIKERDQRTIITNSQEIVELFGESSNSEIYCTGGLLRSFDKGFYGPWTIRNINSTSMAAVVLSSGGVKNWNGLGAISFEDGDVKRAYVKNSEFVIAMLDSSKFNQSAFVEAVRWEDIDLVVTDKGISDNDLEKISLITKIIVV
jgi:DeoR/GlpR family transcriptional regulator of sugar metabolism